jgi:Glycosyltransferase 61
MVAMAKEWLPLSTAPYVRMAKRVLFGPGTAKSASVREEVLFPEETTVTQPAIYLPGQLDRVTGGTEHQSVETEIKSMLAPTYRHAATVAYHIKDAVIFDGSVYAGNLKYFVAEKALFGSSAEPRHFKLGGLSSSTVGTSYFGHWLRDDCIQYLLAERTGAAICIGHTLSDHQRKYARYFGQDWTPTNRAVIDELVVYQDYAQNSLKRQRYEILSRHIAQRFPRQGSRQKLVYVRRGSTGVLRPIQNEAELQEALVKHGFEILDVASDGLDRILETLRHAKLVVSIEGSQNTHCCFSLASGCGMLVLQPCDRFTSVHRHWTECVGVHFGFVVGDKSASGYQFSTFEVLSTVEKLLQRIDAHPSSS